MRVILDECFQTGAAEALPLVWGREADVLPKKIFTARHTTDVSQFPRACAADHFFLGTRDDTGAFQMVTQELRTHVRNPRILALTKLKVVDRARFNGENRCERG